MFIGSLSSDMRIITEKFLDRVDGKNVYVGCSGNFTFDRMAAAKGYRVLSNDVSLYSALIAAIVQKKEFPCRCVNEELCEIFMTTVSFTFSETGYEQIDRVLARLDEQMLNPEYSFFVHGDVDEFIRVSTEIKKRLNIKSRSVAFAKMCEICSEWLGKEAETETPDSPQT